MLSLTKDLPAESFRWKGCMSLGGFGRLSGLVRVLSVEDNSQEQEEQEQHFEDS